MILDNFVGILCCPRCNSNLEYSQHSFVCTKCGQKVTGDGRLLDFRDLTPEVPLHFAKYTQELHESAGQTMSDVPLDWRVQASLEEAKLLGSGDVCLEIGGADGPMTPTLETLYNNTLCIDFAMSFLERIVKKTAKTVCLCGDAHFLPVKDESVNLVVCSEVLEHVTIPTQLLLEIRRVLAKDGKCLLSVPNEGKLEFLMSRRTPHLLPASDSHVSFYTAATLKMFLFRMGFEVIEFRYLSAPIRFSLSPRQLARNLRNRIAAPYLFCIIQPMKNPDVYWESLAHAINAEAAHRILEAE